MKTIILLCTKPKLVDPIIGVAKNLTKAKKMALETHKHSILTKCPKPYTEFEAWQYTNTWANECRKIVINNNKLTSYNPRDIM
jgi:hypothetical protein